MAAAKLSMLLRRKMTAARDRVPTVQSEVMQI